MKLFEFFESARPVLAEKPAERAIGQ